jgi:putative transposase
VIERLKTRVGVSALCRCLGYSRQGYYQRLTLEARREALSQGTLKQVQELRRDQPVVGGRKLHRMIQPSGLGRDRFFELLRREGLLIKPRRSFRRTTYPGGRRFPNIARTFKVRRPGELLVSDITYLDTQEGFCYLFLTTDYYSRKVVGYALRRDLTAQGAREALAMALKSVPSGGVHHSDRGWQYSAQSFQQLLESHGIRPSMTEEEHVYENAVAERINGILKYELGLRYRLESFEAAKKVVAHAVAIYNTKRLHTSLAYKTPSQAFAESVNYSRT